MTPANAILTRRSTRAFLPNPVPRETIEEILRIASHAPSGSNIQPWRVHVMTGETLARVVADMEAAFLDDETGHGREYKYYTESWEEPWLGRRRACGWGLYGMLGIGKGERDKSKAYRVQNYRFFGAPVGMVFTIDKKLELGAWIDYGMFLQNIMVAARGFGLHTCPEASIAEYPKILRPHLGIGDGELVMCGMALGEADPDALVNTFQPQRCTVAEFATFHE